MLRFHLTGASHLLCDSQHRNTDTSEKCRPAPCCADESGTCKEKKYDLQSKQLQGTEGREKYKVYGELINTYGYNLDPEAKSLTCLNYYTNEDITIPLDPQKTPQENAQKYFLQNTISRSVLFEALSELIQETADEIRYLESVSNSLDIALSEADLGQIKEELTASGYVRRKFTKKKSKTD